MPKRSRQDQPSGRDARILGDVNLRKIRGRQLTQIMHPGDTKSCLCEIYHRRSTLFAESVGEAVLG